MCHLNQWNKKWGSPSSFRWKWPFISLNNSAFIENPSSSEGARARARAKHARNDAQKGCVMQLNGITLRREQGKRWAARWISENVLSWLPVFFVFAAATLRRQHLSRSSVTVFAGMLQENITSFNTSDLSYGFMIYLCSELKTFENSSHGQTIRVHSTRIE